MIPDYEINRRFRQLCCRIEALKASISGGTTASIQFTVGDPGAPSAGNTITVTELIGKTVLVVFIDGPAVQDYIFDSTTGELDLTSRGGVTDDSVVTIIYK